MKAPVQAREPWGMIGNVSRTAIHPESSSSSANAAALSLRVVRRAA